MYRSWRFSESPQVAGLDGERPRQTTDPGSGDLDLGDSRVDGEEWTDSRDVMSRWMERGRKRCICSLPFSAREVGLVPSGFTSQFLPL